MNKTLFAPACAALALSAAAVGPLWAADDDIIFGTENGAVFLRSGVTLAGLNSDSYGGGTITGLGMLSNNTVALTHAQASPAIIRVRDADTFNSVAADTFGSGPFQALRVRSDDRLATAQYDASLPSTTTLRIRTVTPPDTTHVAADQGNFGPVTGFSLLSNDDVVIGNPLGQIYVRNGVDLNGVAFDSFGNGGITALAVQSDDDIVLAQYDTGTGNTTLRIRRISGSTTNGVSAAVGSFYGRVTAMGILSTDDVVVANDAGGIFVLNGADGADFATIASDSFGGGGITALAIQSDDDIFLAQHDATTTTLRLRRISGNTTNGVAADTGAFGIITAVTIKLPPKTEPEWNVDLSGDWNFEANWNGRIPNSSGAVANFKGAITAARTVYTDLPVTVGTLRFDNANAGYTLTGLGTLTIQRPQGSGSIEVLSGSHKINLPLFLAQSTDASVASGATLTIADPLQIASGATLTKLGGGTLNILSTVDATGPAVLALTGGTTHLDFGVGSAASSGSAAVANVAVSVSGSTLKLGADQTLRGLDAATGDSGDQEIDLAGKLVRVYPANRGAEEASIYGDIKSAVLSASGKDGIYDSTIASSNYAVGVTDQAVDAHGDHLVVVKKTILGDTNVDGHVDVIDLGMLATGWQTNGLWDNGDSNFDGFIDVIDLGMLATNWQQSAGGPSLGEALAAYGLPSVSVPEPALIGLVGILGALPRRRPGAAASTSRGIMHSLFLRVCAIGLLAWTVPLRGECLSAGRAAGAFPDPNDPAVPASGLACLTDGRQSEDLSAGTWVGWRTAERIWVTIELGGVCQIDSVSIHTIAAPAEGIALPRLVAVFSEEPGRGFFNYIAEMPVPTPPSEDQKVYVLSSPGLQQVRTSEVKLELMAQPGKRLLIDEIEVAGARLSPLVARPTIATSRPATQATEPGRWLKPRPVMRSAAHLRTRIEQDLQQIKTNAGRLAPERRQPILAAADELEKGAASLHEGAEIDLSKGPPYGAEHRKLFLLNSRIAQAALQQKPLVVWEADPWINAMNPLVLPPANATAPKLAVRMLQNEFEPVTFNLTNCTGQDLPVRLRIEGLESEGIAVHEAVFVEAASHEMLADALPLAPRSGSGRELVVPRGSTRQVWISINSRSLAAGQHQAGVLIEPQGGDAFQVPLIVDVLPIRLPDRKHLRTYHWGYMDWPLTQGREKECDADLRSHYQNTTVISWIYRPVVSRKGDQTILDLTNLDKALDFEPNAETYLIWLGMDGPYKTLGIDGEFMGPEWSQSFAAYLKQLTDHLKSKGIGYDRFALYLVDEPSVDPRRGDILFLDLCALIKVCDPHVRLFANACFEEQPPTAVPLLGAAYDILCPQMRDVEIHAAFNDYLKTGKAVWSYRIGTGKSSSPLRYYRQYVWQTWSVGFTGAGYWNYCDTGWGNYDSQERSAWDDFDDQERGPDSSFIYENILAAPITSRRWEAWREGVEDYECLWMLREAIGLARSKGDAAAVQAARAVLDEVPAAFLAECQRSDAEASAVLAQARTRLLSSLLALSAVAGGQ